MFHSSFPCYSGSTFVMSPIIPLEAALQHQQARALIERLGISLHPCVVMRNDTLAVLAQSNAQLNELHTNTGPKAVVYVIVVLMLYALALAVALIKYIRQERYEARLYHLYDDFMRRDRFLRLSKRHSSMGGTESPPSPLPLPHPGSDDEEEEEVEEVTDEQMQLKTVTVNNTNANHNIPPISVTPLVSLLDSKV